MTLNNHTFSPLAECPTGNNSEFQCFEFEWIYNQDILIFFQRHWHVSYYIGLVYTAAIFGLQGWMRDKLPYSLKPALFVWNLCLAIFSVTVFWRNIPTYISIITHENGFYKSVCVKESLNPKTTFWIFVFAFSKLIELGDTIFIVLRKRPLVFIHWCHHLMTLAVSWTNAPLMEPINIWYLVLNSGVHSALYLYFVAKTLSLPIPNFMRTMLTTVQFVQIIIGFSVNVVSIYLKGFMGYDCARETISIIGSCIMGISFVVLFGNLLYASLRKVERHQKLA